MPVVQVNTWLLNDSPAETIDKLKSAEGLGAVKGLQGTWSGTAEEDQKRFLNVTVFDTLENQQAFKDDPVYPAVRDLARSTQDKDVRRANVELNHDFMPALNAPITEILHMKLKEGKTKLELYLVLEVIAAGVHAEKKYAPATWGPTTENPREFYLFIGWESMEVHEQHIKSPLFKPIAATLEDAAVLEMYHVGLKKNI